MRIVSRRIVVVYHGTWFVNSAAHYFGYKTIALKDDLSTNCWWVGIIAYGEGWHNNHHAFPKSAKHGLLPWEFDMTWMAICVLRFFGLAKDIKIAKLTPQTCDFGYKTIALKDDLSTNCWWVGIIAYGEGWHNNHHAFPNQVP